MKRYLKRHPSAVRTVVLVVLCGIALLPASRETAVADQGFVWRYAPAAPPPPPPGEPPAPYPLPLGTVGQISFWSPNHGLLITGGTEVVKPGLYEYDGVEWRQLATVCGGAEGRIAWAGPDDFWTVSDQRAGQIQGRQEGTLQAISLCHFLDGRVLASYAMPLGQPESYLQMDAASCLSASDCWFAGEDGRPPNAGSFHLHWDGSAVTAIYDASDHAVTGMASFEGELYEGLAIGPEDAYLPEESSASPRVLRTIVAEGRAPSCEAGEPPFGPLCNAFLAEGATHLPVYPHGARPEVLGGFDVASDGTGLGEDATRLWAGADPPVGSGPGGVPAPVTIIEDRGEGSWTQVIPRLENGKDGTTPLQSGEELGGSTTDQFTSQSTAAGNAIAPEPGTESAWLSLRGRGERGARVARLETNGTLHEPEELPNRKLDPVGGVGEAGPIACAAAADCWMATTQGWLFHLGAEHERYQDPYFESLITERPPDASVPVIYPDVPPVEEVANQPPVEATPRLPASKPRTRVRRKALVQHLKSKFVGGRVLVLSFTLTGRAHVQLLAKRAGRTVASTPRESLRPGRHRLSLTLDPARWPNKLQFNATPAQTPAAAGGGSGPSASTGEENGDTLAT